MSFFDTSEIGRPFSQDLFAENRLPFAAYLEPEGMRRLSSVKKVFEERYSKDLPKTFEISAQMLLRVLQRARWGIQLPDGRWTTIQEGKVYSSGSRKWLGEKAGQLDLLRHLCGLTYSCGATDIATPHYMWVRDQLHSNVIRCLRLDIDQDSAWEEKDVDSVIAPLLIHREILMAIGLPYRVFSTGGRGVQAVVPLPLNVPPVMASLIEAVIVTAIGMRTPQGMEGAVDKTALRVVLRLPGGLHAKTGRLGAWICLNEKRLFNIDEQAELLKTGFSWQDGPGLITAAQFRSEIDILLRLMRKEGLQATSHLDLGAAVVFLEKHADLPFASQLLSALDHQARKRCSPRDVEQTEPTSPVSTSIPETDPAGIPMPFTGPASKGHKDWAHQVWDQSFTAGHFYDWINMNGQKGILAARIIFGDEGAREQLLNRAKEVPCRSAEQRAERIRVINKFCATFRSPALRQARGSEHVAKDPDPVFIDLKIEDLAKESVALLLPKSGKVRWNKELAWQLLAIILQGIHDSDIGQYVGSLDSLTGAINSTWPQAATNRQRVAEMVRRLCEKTQNGKHILFRRSGRHAASQPDQYRCGTALLGSWLFGPADERAERWHDETVFAELDEDD